MFACRTCEGRFSERKGTPLFDCRLHEVKAVDVLAHLLSSACLTTPLGEYARVFKAQHRVEECLQQAKGEAGLGDYEARTWRGWRHHQALALVATWFLTQEARLGKKWTPTVTQVQELTAGVVHR